ncbi:superoxide dismutase, Fe-Mn family [Abditibacterium utsteinense]|uniref:superoxide dismutase n=1 Tax=Abditibacterium utsteinense TaxID=1960156 RepID=A0A2S8SQR0_9BACT|nr:superoxide dismutase [Abditibacterium utsteinense]PQV63133.1 superoxide dismutase, Fe-Mn family [Abditibacterium utsteinense]
MKTPENPSTEREPNLERRNFLQTAALAAGAVAIGSAVSSAAAQSATQEISAGNYPTLPQLAERPLKASTLNTEGISRRTHEEHFKLYQGYVKKGNELMEKISTISRDSAKANQTYSELREAKVELSFALGGVKNHELYFDILGGIGSRPEGRLLEEINRSFGSVQAWTADLKATGIAARGWVWTAYDYDLKRLMNYIGDAQNTYPIWNATPIIGLDVYEHAYYLDFGTKRADYIDAFLRNLNWNSVGTRFAQLGAPAGNLVTLA